ncbi:hypothetical protein GCM10009116_12190 [Brevundimonas basaltis]|uniref:DUF883 domain-containing protein n=1 Tax=Brevundimonas basaltis TaxID=472166 RepID=A0A7W8MF89_9CAUL|nr:hypothetical protein [Brevundimonas basaltis]MBB5290655.1 hypothetical protein [Brevundimonas basaltis]
MSETYTGPTRPEDIDEPVELESTRLEREADAILLEGEARTFGPRPIHEAVREDAEAARVWGRTRADRLRRAVEDEPMKATLYALGLGVVIGMLAAR